MDAELYIVKEAGAAEAAMRYAGTGVGRLRDAARFLLSAHPLEKSYGAGALNKLKGVGHVVGDFVREGAIGSPLTVGQELRKKGLGGYYRDALLGTGQSNSGRASNLMMMAAFPALDIYGAAKAPEGHRGEAVGRAVGSAALLPLTSRLGVPGQLLLHAPATRLAGRLGRLFDPKPQPPPTAPPPVQP